MEYSAWERLTGKNRYIDIGERQEVGDIEDWRVLEESCDVLEGVDLT